MLTTTPNATTPPEMRREIYALRTQVKEMKFRLATVTTIEDRQDAKQSIETAQRLIDQLERNLRQSGFERR